MKKQDILRVYSDVFTGIGKFPGPPYKFQLKPNVKLARHAPRHAFQSISRKHSTRKLGTWNG